MASSPLRRAMTNAAVMTVTLGVCLGFTEVVVRLLHKPVPTVLTNIDLKTSRYYQRDPDIGWRPRPNVEGRFSLAGSFETTFRTNARGLRGAEISYLPASGQKRIVVLGDSFTWGYGVEDEESYPARLGALLPGFEVVNLGVTAFGLPQEIRYFELEGRKYDPDIVVVGLCMNDIYRVRLDGPPKPMTVSIRVPRDRSGDGGLKSFLARNLATYRFVRERVNTNKKLVNLLVDLGLKDGLVGFDGLDVNLSPALKLYPPQLERSWERTEQDILTLRDRVEDAGARLVVAFIPTLQTIDRTAFKHSIAYTVYNPEDFDLEKPYRRMRAFLGEHGIAYVDAIERFRANSDPETGSGLFLMRDMHFNARGHELFAQAIAERIREGR